MNALKKIYFQPRSSKETDCATKNLEINGKRGQNLSQMLLKTRKLLSLQGQKRQKIEKKGSSRIERPTISAIFSLRVNFRRKLRVIDFAFTLLKHFHWFLSIK